MRKDYFRDRYTVVAPQRALRKIDVPATLGVESTQTSAEAERVCSFCPGHEAETPPAVLMLPPSGPWRVRVVPNLFPIAAGAHEVVIETPLHSATLPTLGLDQIELVLTAIRTRLATLYRRRQSAWVQAFANQGRSAGASLRHAHAQLVALPFIPTDISEKSAHSQPPDCAYCRMVACECEGPRAVMANDSFVAFCPLAPSWEGEVWIVARRHVQRLPSPRARSARDLATILRQVLGVVEKTTPAYNLMIFSGAPGMAFHLHVEIAPRSTDAIKAGLELATGVAVVRKDPESTAAAYRASLAQGSATPFLE